MTRARQDLILGLVFFGGLALLIWATFELSSLSFAPPIQAEIFFTHGAGLRAGDPVFVLGHRVGKVDFIEYRGGQDPENRIRVVVSLDRPVAFAEDYNVSIRDGSLLGGKQLEIDPGVSATLHPANKVLRGEVKPGGINALGELLDDPQIKDDFKAIVGGIRQAVDKINSNDSALGRLLNETRLYDEFLATVQSARRSVEEVEKGGGVLSRLIYDRNLGDNLVAIGERVTSIATKIDTGEGLLGTLVNDRQMGQDARQLISDAKEIVADTRAGKGALGVLLQDEETARKVKEIVDGVADVVAKARDPASGLIGELFAGRELRARVIGIVDDIADVTREVRHGRGLLNRLVYDEGMGDQVTRILNQVSRAIEDAREAAPIGTFFQVFSGAF
jgi:phospholipid/cholesterol/gamma-HCH transport system substrate-binding protein